MQTLLPLAEQIAARLQQQQQTVAVAESSSGGLISAALLAIPGASAYFVSGAVIYTSQAREGLYAIDRAAMQNKRSSSEPYAKLLAQTARERFATTWGLAETGAAGPTGNRYGDAAGHSCIALAGPREAALIIATGDNDRVANMRAFALAGLQLLRDNIQ